MSYYDLDDLEILESIALAYRSGLSFIEVARQFRCSVHAIRSRIPESQIREQRVFLYRELNSELIYQLYLEGMSKRKLAVRFGCSATTISNRIAEYQVYLEMQE